MISASLFANEPRQIDLSAGGFLFHEGDDPDFLYILLSGHARILIGKREVETFGPGQLVGELALIEKAPRTASVQAIADCRFACIDQKRFDFLITETPRFALAVMRTMAERLRGADRVIESRD